MKLLIVSDSHGDRKSLEQLKAKYKDKVDAMIHCGDSELSANDPVIEGFSTVRGNCDFDSNFPNELELQVKGNAIFITHGHLYQVNSTLMNIAYRAKELHAEFTFFGHSHLLGVEIIDGILFLNPGSILHPRGGNEKTYAIVEKEGTKISVEFFNENDELLSDFARVF